MEKNETIIIKIVITDIVEVSMIKIYVDSATDNKTSHIGVGGVIHKQGEQHLFACVVEEALTNHQAEFEAVYQVLKYVIQQEWESETIVLYSDSQVVVKALERQSSKHEWQQQYIDKIMPLIKQCALILFEWYNDRQNKAADLLAKKAFNDKKHSKG